MAREFAIVANGYADGPPAEPLREFLVARGARVVTIFHPLLPEQGARHRVATYDGGGLVDEREIGLPLRPPKSFLLDPLVPVLPPRVDVWFGFNPLACARGLVARAVGRAKRTVLWSIDFVPDRFGPDTLATRVYDRLDRLCCVRADARVELSQSALEARNSRHRLAAHSSAAHVVPMGAWTEDVPTTVPDGFATRRVVYLGHLVPRQGVETLLEAIGLLVARGEPLSADIVGTGPLEGSLRERARAAGLDEAVRFHGFVRDQREVERILAGAAVAVAPYLPSPDNFTRYADPGKLKAYLAAGLPIVLTDVPPNARELERRGGAEVVAPDSSSIAEGIARAFGSPELWQARRAAALDCARGFDWDMLFSELFRKLGLELPRGGASAAPSAHGRTRQGRQPGSR